MIEAYSSAVLSSNLKCDPYHKSIERVMAMAGANSVGALAIRAKYVSFPAAVSELYRVMSDRASKKATVRKWPSSINPESVATAAVSHWLSHLCESCRGTRPIGCHTCKVCAGSGEAELSITGPMRGYVLDLVSYLNIVVRLASTTAAARL